MEPRGSQLTPDLFPLKAPCKRQNDWYLDLFIALRVALGIDPSFDAGIGGGYNAPQSPPWNGIDGELVGGIRAVGTKKKSAGQVIQVEYALFSPDGAALAWCGSLDASFSTPVHDLLYRRPDGTKLELDAPLKARIKGLTLSKPKKADLPAAPFVAEFPLRVVAAADQVVAGADMKSNVYLWDATSGDLRARIKVGGGGMKFLHQIALSPDGALAAVGASSVNVLDVATGKPVLKIAGHPKGEVWGIQFSPDGKTIATASRGPRGTDNSVALWDAASGAQLHRWPYANPGAACTWLAFSADGTSLVFSTERPAGLHRIDLKTRQVVASVELGTASDALAPSQHGWVVVVDHTLVLCDPLTLEVRAKVDYPLGAAGRQHLAATPDRARIVAGRRDIGVLDGATLALEKKLVENSADAFGVATDGKRAFSVDGRSVIPHAL